MDRTGEAWQNYERSLYHYGGDEFIVIALEGEEQLGLAALESVVSITEALEGLDGVRRVDSLATVPLIRADQSGNLLLDASLAEGIPRTEAERVRLIELIRSDRVAPGSLVSADERVIAINVVLDAKVNGDRSAVVSAIRSSLSNHQVQVSGVPVFRTEVNSRTRSEILIFIPAALALIAVVLALLFRSVSGIVVPLVVGCVGVVCTLGAMGAAGATLSLSTMILPSILLAIGCAYTMHVLTAVGESRDGAAFTSAIVYVGRPIVISGVTTAIGFLAMATVTIDAIRELATFGAFGVLCLTGATLTLAPAILSAAKSRPQQSTIAKWLRGQLRQRLVTIVVFHRRTVLIVWMIALVGFAVGVRKLDVATDIILWFPPGNEVRDSYERIRKELSGITPVNVMIEAGDNLSVTEPDVIRAVDRLSGDLEKLPIVGKSLSIGDPLRQMQGVLSGGRDKGLPGKKETIEQYLLLLESKEQIRDLIRFDYKGLNILLRVDNNSSREIVGIAEWVDSWWSRFGVPGYSATTTGIMFEFGRAEEAIAHGQIRGLSLALVAIGTVLLVILRSVRVALIALLPNAVPLVMAFGFMGLAGIPLDAATVCLGSLALGIAVDDTIHVVSGFRQRKDSLQSNIESLDGCFAQVLPALVFTTVCISIGFLVLGFSSFSLVRNLGLVTCGLVAVCLAADTTLLPALLLGEKRPAVGVSRQVAGAVGEAAAR